MQALSDKYFRPENASSAEVVYVSRSKPMEEVGFEKFAHRQAELRGIHVLVLDRMRIRYGLEHDDGKAIAETCANITDVDLSGNLFESLDEVLRLCQQLPKLRSLTLDGNRFVVITNKGPKICLPGVRSLSLSNTLIDDAEVTEITAAFPSVDSLVLSANDLDHWAPRMPPGCLRSLDLSNNNFKSLHAIRSLATILDLRTLILRRNRISHVGDETESFTIPLSATIQEIDVSHNSILSWSFFADLHFAFPSLKHLRVSDNPLYHDLHSAEGNPLSTQDGYMLTIARLPHLDTLNYSKISDKERLNAETYYLNQIAIELSRAPPGTANNVLEKHPRWQALCTDYGEPTINRKDASDAIDSNSLAARLVTFSFHIADGTLTDMNGRSWTDEVPRSFSVYALYGIVGKRLGVMPLRLRLVWETGERDPASSEGKYNGPEWWDSSDDETATDEGARVWVMREVELVPGTRPLGTYVEGREAKVRVELKAV